jgi:DNA-binding LytR/AlgR family response regulator
VNMNHVTYYEGSASKGELHFDLISDVVPVSRTYATAISESLR